MLPLNDGWLFRAGRAGAVFASGGDAESWERVSLPHTWNARDGTSADYRRGQGWYRLEFDGPKTSAGERVLIEFAGVSLVTTVWLNGTCVGTHDNGFSTFRFDITDALRPEERNTLVVLADSAARDAVPPREGDFTMFGGIYRPVSLLVVPAIAVDPTDHGGPGVYLRTPDVTTSVAKIDARVLVRNTTTATQSVNVNVAIHDAAGELVCETIVNHLAGPGTSDARLELCVDRPRLWRGRRDPYLYRAVTTLRDNGHVIDTVTQPLGLRSFAIDPERGFMLNGEPYDLRGVNLHQDRAGRGWALVNGDRADDFRHIMEMGCTFVRLAHYQHASEAYELADRLGLVIWTEIAFVNTASSNPAFAERCSIQLRELIRQNFNHPSVVFWGIGNEVQTKEPPAKTLLEHLALQAKLEDPGRLSTLATNYAEPVGAYGVASIAHNQYHGWYHSTPDAFAQWIDNQRAKTPGMSLGMAEYGAGAGATIHRATPERLDHSEEYQAIFHEAYWRALRDRPWVWCKGVWVMYDFASAARREGEADGINDKGLVTRDRRTRKDAFYWYQANWTTEPMVHITSRRFTPRNQAVTDIKVYSNCESVELRLNGESLGERGVEEHIARWMGVPLRPGVNDVEVVARKGPTTVADRCTWTLSAAEPTSAASGAGAAGGH